MDTQRDQPSPLPQLAVFPDSATVRDGTLVLGGVTASDLARDYGTPLLVLDTQTIRSRTAAWIDAFESWEPGTTIAFACKSLCVGAALQVTVECGAGADVASQGEMAVALASGVNPANMVLHGNNKSRADLDHAVRAGLGYVVLDAPDELDLLEDVVSASGLPPQQVLVRVNPDIEVETHRYIRTGHAGSKFGVSAELAISMLQAARRSQHLIPSGLHVHLGSQLLDSDPWQRVIAWLGPLVRTLTDEGTPVRVLDIGGGLGISYLPEQSPPAINDIARLTMDTVRTTWGEQGLDELPQLIVEPGRSIIGEAGTTLYTVGVVKRDGPIGYVNVDGGMSDNPRPMLYQAQYTALLANRADVPTDEQWWVAGVHCESGDVLIEDAELPSPRRGDLLAVASTGAYTVSMGSNYNAQPRPAVVMVEGGSSRLAVRRETLDDVMARDMVAGAS